MLVATPVTEPVVGGAADGGNQPPGILWSDRLGVTTTMAARAVTPSALARFPLLSNGTCPLVHSGWFL